MNSDVEARLESMQMECDCVNGMQASPSLEKNWEQAQLLYLQGTPSSEIARMLGCKKGTLDSRISRAGLPALREKQLQEGRADRTKQKIAACAENIMDQLSAKTPKSADALNLHADTLLKATKIGAVVHGWGENPSVAVIVHGLHGNDVNRAADWHQFQPNC